CVRGGGGSWCGGVGRWGGGGCGGGGRRVDGGVVGRVGGLGVGGGWWGWVFVFGFEGWGLWCGGWGGRLCWGRGGGGGGGGGGWPKCQLTLCP
ncbi:MAG: hypothetical protein GY775_14205, partial [Candidatus Scalindua sp.]|nr:hypothetical protein [Candidatus Scalindua sp.]